MKIFSPNENPVLYNGYYVYKGNAYTNRDSIVEDMVTNNDYKSPVQFYFHDEVFDQIDWTNEPEESIEELYLQRAKQLRDKYNYLILSYSGGSDSQQILDIFLKHNIFIDEIQTVSWEKVISKLNKQQLLQDKSLKFLLEYDLNVVPNLKKVADKSPNTKITVLDTSDYLINDVTSGNFETIGIKNLGAYRAILVPVPRSWTLTQNYHMNNTVKRDGVCIIQGVEKPHFHIENNDCFFRFSDAGYYCEKFINNKIIDNVYRSEYFYWSPDCPKIVVKQANMLKKAVNRDQMFYDMLENVKVSTKKHFEEKIPNKAFKSIAYDDLDDYVTEIIYPNSRVIYEFGKPTKIGPEFLLMTRYHGLGDRITSAMQETLKYRLNRYRYVHSSVKTTVIFSKKYFVGKLQPFWRFNR